MFDFHVAVIMSRCGRRSAVVLASQGRVRVAYIISTVLAVLSVLTFCVFGRDVMKSSGCFRFA